MNDITVSCLFVIGLMIAVFLSLPSLSVRGNQSTSGHRRRTEQAYHIRRKRDGYPMVVNRATVDKAVETDEYIYEGPASEDTAGGYFTNDGLSTPGGMYVPSGHMVVDGSKYEDERLN